MPSATGDVERRVVRRASRVVSVLAVAALLVGCGSTSSPSADGDTTTTPGDGAMTSAVPSAAPSSPTGPLTFTTTSLTITDPTRGTVSRSPLPATDSRLLHTTVRVPDGGGPWPLVVFGHGYSASAATYGDLLDAMAGAGFVVAAPEFPGSSSALPGQPDERDLQDEPCDLLLVAARVQAAAGAAGPLEGKVRAGPVALAGQSDGATAAAYAVLSSTCDITPTPEVAALVAFSAQPAPLRPGLDPAGLPALLAVTGSADDVNRPARTRALFDQFAHRAWFLTSAGDGHLAPSTDSPHRAAITAIVIDLLHGALDPDPAALARITPDAEVPGLTLDAHP